MKKILQVVETLDCGGIETLLVSLNEFIDKNYKFDYLLGVNRQCFYSDKVQELGAKIYYVPSRNKGLLQHIKELNNFFRNNQFDIIHYNCSSLSNILYLYFAKKYGIKKRIVHVHSVSEPNNKIHFFLHKFHKLFIKNLATDFLSCSMLASKWAYPNSVIKSEQHQIINNGINLSKFYFNKALRVEIREQLNLNDSTIVLGCIGRFIESKNQSFCIEIIKELLTIQDNFYLLLIGDGPTKELINERIIDNNLQNKVHILSATPNVSQYYQCMDYFIFPSLFEGLGMTVIEAQVSGLPCVIFDNLPVELNISENLYRMNKYSTPKDWSKLIIDIQKETKDRHSVYCEDFDIKKIVRELEVIYDRKS